MSPALRRGAPRLGAVSSEPVEPTAEVPLWNVANVLTMVRIALVPVFAVLVLQGTTAGYLWGALVFALAALTDKVDGHLARSRGLVTDFGKLADPIADKALMLTALVLLSVAGTLPWWITIVIIVRELGITLLRFVMVRRGVVMPASKGGKLKTLLQAFFIGGLLVPWHAFLPDVAATVMVTLAWVLVAAGLLVTVVTGIDYLLRARRLARA